MEAQQPVSKESAMFIEFREILSGSRPLDQNDSAFVSDVIHGLLVKHYFNGSVAEFNAFVAEAKAKKQVITLDGVKFFTDTVDSIDMLSIFMAVLNGDIVTPVFNDAMCDQYGISLLKGSVATIRWEKRLPIEMVREGGKFMLFGIIPVTCMYNKPLRKLNREEIGRMGFNPDGFVPMTMTCRFKFDVEVITLSGVKIPQSLMSSTGGICGIVESIH